MSGWCSSELTGERGSTWHACLSLVACSLCCGQREIIQLAAEVVEQVQWDASAVAQVVNVEHTQL